MMGGHLFRPRFGDPATADPAALTARALDAVRTVRTTPQLPFQCVAVQRGPLNTARSSCVCRCTFQQLGIAATPVHTACHILQQCIPQYTVGHPARLDRLHATLATARTAAQADGGVARCLSLVGAGYVGVGVNDLALGAHRLAANLHRSHLAGLPPPTGLEQRF